MELTDIMFLGLVQGVTEFLPVSSSGHLVLARILFKVPDTAGTATDAFLHLGTLLAVLTYYRGVWWAMLRALFVKDAEGVDKRQLIGKLILATVPAALAGYFLANTIDQMFRAPTMVAIGFAITAIVFIAAELIHKRQVPTARMGWRQSLLTGIAQVFALFPGVSRSGTTIAAGQAQGLSRSQAAHFSFLMSAPIIAGAGLGTLPALLTSQVYQGNVLLAGFIVSFLSGMITIALLLKLTEKISFIPFAIYLIAVSIGMGLLL